MICKSDCLLFTEQLRIFAMGKLAVYKLSPDILHKILESYDKTESVSNQYLNVAHKERKKWDSILGRLCSHS